MRERAAGQTTCSQGRCTSICTPSAAARKRWPLTWSGSSVPWTGTMTVGTWRCRMASRGSVIPASALQLLQALGQRGLGFHQAVFGKVLVLAGEQVLPQLGDAARVGREQLAVAHVGVGEAALEKTALEGRQALGRDRGGPLKVALADFAAFPHVEVGRAVERR